MDYLLRRLHNYPITNEAKDIEKNTIKNILRNKEYDIKAISKSPPGKRKHKLTHRTKKQSGQHVHIVAKK
jgi:hypothetical protein